MSIIRVGAGKTADIRGEIAVSRWRRFRTRAGMQISKDRSRIARIVGLDGCRRSAKRMNLVDHVRSLAVSFSATRNCASRGHLYRQLGVEMRRCCVDGVAISPNPRTSNNPSPSHKVLSGTARIQSLDSTAVKLLYETRVYHFKLQSIRTSAMFHHASPLAVRIKTQY